MHYYTVGNFRCGNCKKEFEQALSVQLVQLVPVAKIKELESIVKKQQERAEQLEKELISVREEHVKLTTLYSDTNTSLQQMQEKTESLNNELEIAGLDMKVKDLERDVVSLEKERSLLQARVAQLSPPEA
jgi:predicted  nucleic acid-binding Zn-ribbon protein